MTNATDHPGRQDETATPPQRRLVAAVVAAACLAVLIVAACLRPRSAGYGTAQQLALPPCSLLVRTGYPCPTCGLTTSVSAMAHGKVGLAFRAHPFGVVLFVGLVVVLVAATVQLITGRRALRRLAFRRWWLVLLGLLAACWGWLILAGVADGRWPIR